MMRTISVFRISVHELVIAPRPKVGPRLDTVGACQIRACVSRATIPRPRATFTDRKADSLDEAEEIRKPVLFQRLTVTPLSLVLMKFASRSFFMCVATRVSASSQEMRFHSLEPASRTCG